MRLLSPVRIASHLALLGVIGLCAGCTGSLAVAPPAAPATVLSPQDTATVPTKEAVHSVGLLTLKGAEMDAWWALSDDSGTVWRLVPASAEQVAAFRQWQNRRVSIDGVRLGALLNTPRVKVERVRLVR